jgi:hypothetical protein
MAQDNLLQFRTRIRRYLKELDPNTSFWPDNFVNQLFNAQYRRRCSQLIMAFEGWFTNVATRDLVADQDSYSFPPDFVRMRKLELDRTDGRTVPVQSFERHAEVNPPEGNEVDQYMPTYRPLGNGFVLEPKPSVSQTGGLRIEFEVVPQLLTADTDQIHESFPTIFDELLVLDTVVSAFDAEGVQESGRLQTVLRLRQEWEWDFSRFIDQRVVRRQNVSPFAPHYFDA